MKTRIILLIAIVLGITTQGFNQQKMTKFTIHTKFGDIKGELYNDTPKHRDNFIKLVKEGWYENSIFHRVIQNFMIQGGQNANGKVDPGYTVPAEILPNHFHKKGALAAARMGDQVNPKRESSGSQFYIVQGQVYDAATLDSFEQRTGLKYTPEQRAAYSTVGGTPHLDGAYTVFGQITSGLDVVEKIAAVKTAPGDRPVEDVKMTIEIDK